MVRHFPQLQLKSDHNMLSYEASLMPRCHGQLVVSRGGIIRAEQVLNSKPL